MLSVRSLARSVPRTLGRLTTASVRQGSIVTARPVISAVASARTKISAMPAVTGFSTTTAGRRAAAVGETDDELSAKIESEIQIEQEMKASEQEPSSIRDFLDNSPFELIDTPGQEVVKLVRDFGDEKITISFSISEINDFDDYSDESAMGEEDMGDGLAGSGDGKRGAGQQGDAVAAGAGEEGDPDAESDDEPPAPITLSIVIEKPGKTPGALHVDASAQDGAIVVDNLFHYADAELARMDSPEAVQRRADAYPGPPFGSLDEDLQVLMERFLEERGIGQALAVFVPDYVDLKEQNEYLRWLGNVKGFIDA